MSDALVILTLIAVSITAHSLREDEHPDRRPAAQMLLHGIEFAMPIVAVVVAVSWLIRCH